MNRELPVEPSAAASATTRSGAYDAATGREQQRLDTQSDLYGELAAWTLDALGIGPGQRVLEFGCGTGPLLAAAAQRVGPAGRVVAVDRNPRLLAAARERVSAYPWVELVEADANAYDGGGARFDAVHCRLVLMHQPAPDAFLARMVALTRPGGRVAAQEHDVDGATGAPTLTCFPPFPAFDRLAAAFLAVVPLLGSDPQAGRKLPMRFRQAGLTTLLIRGSVPCFALTDPRMTALLDLVGGMIGGSQAAATGVMAAADYDALVAEVCRGYGDPAYGAHLVRAVLMLATVGTRPA